MFGDSVRGLLKFDQSLDSVLSPSSTSFIFNVEIDRKGAGACLTEQDKSAKEVIASDMSGKKKALSFGNIYK